MSNRMRCWEFLACEETDCPMFHPEKTRCWLAGGADRPAGERQGPMPSIETCFQCAYFKAAVDPSSLEETLDLASERFSRLREMVDDRDRELQETSLELAIGLSEVFVALRKISQGDPNVRIPEESSLELIHMLKHMVNVTAENLGEIVDLSHEFAIGLAEHFDVLHRASAGDLTARVGGVSELELLESLKSMTNTMIENVACEISERKASEASLRESQKLLSKILSASPIGIIIAEKRIVKWVNQSLLDIFGFEREEDCLNRNVEMLYATEDEYHRVSQLIYPYLKEDRPAMADARFRRSDGSLFEGHLKINVLDPSDPMKKSVATISDETWRKQAEAERLRGEKLQGVLETAGATCHELNQPLQIMSLVISEIEDEIPGSKNTAELRRQLGRIRDITNKLDTITTYETMEYVKGKKIIDIYKSSLIKGEPCQPRNKRN